MEEENIINHAKNSEDTHVGSIQEAKIKEKEIESTSEQEKKPEPATNEQPKSKSDKNGLKVAAFILALFAIILSVANCGLLGIVLSQKSLTPTTFVNEFSSSPDGNSQQFAEGSIAEVSNSVSDSVVSILTEVKTTSMNFWGQTQTSTGAAAGTGIIVSSDGYVLTNKHVIESATKIYVVLDDGTVYKDVTLIATDPLNDVAFLKVNNVSDLKPATLGDSKTITTGQQVIAIGNALGQYQNTVTSGIISGTGRSLVATDSNYQNAESLTDMIQTDAAINSGNSGGPLVNAAGEVIGINTAVSDGNGIGFAIPISCVKGMLRTLLETGSAKRAYIGVEYTNIDASIALENNLDSTFGAYVSNVVSGSPAEKAGLKSGDIILAVDGIKIGANSSLATLLGEHSVDDTITLVIKRGGEEQQLSLKLVEYKS
ncbi:trypsin-like peptidase domain-containing protein [Candidatus Saccharibacteria bacterium]|nr:trypsin-like peptidase domain-containing protein [Candidatus Saccharibacteria bacterium]